MSIIRNLEKEIAKQKVPLFHVGDTVDVHLKIVEADKERPQVFTGIVIARRGAGVHETFTVRRIVQGEGVERIFPVHSPLITKIVVKKRGQPRRAKLYYLRQRTGKSIKVKERLKMIPGGELLHSTSSSSGSTAKDSEVLNPDQAKALDTS